MKIEKVKIADLHPLERNVRRHGEKQIAEFIRSLSMFGQTRPFVIDEANTVLIGNGMLEAMKQAGIADGVAYRVKGLTEKQKQKLVLSDNKVYSLGADHVENMEALIRDLGMDGDFDIPGFSEESLRTLSQTADALLDDAMNYGKVETVPGMKAASDRPPVQAGVPAAEAEAQTAAQAQEVPAARQDPDDIPAAEAEAQEGNDQSDEAPAQSPADNSRMIICPNCGEIIRI